MLASLLLAGILPAALAQNPLPEPAHELFEKIRDTSDERLEEMFEKWNGARNDRDWKGLQVCLSEMERRGAERWLKIVSKALKEIESAPREPHTPVHNLELLTVLRRLEGKKDPIRVVVAADQPYTSTFPELPHFQVSLKNEDEGGKPVSITAGGNYRSGRQARWRFEVKDRQGKVFPISQRWGSLGGISQTKELKPGETWSTGLSMRSFIYTLPAGKYSVWIQYSDTALISNMEDVRGWVLCRSPEIKLEVKKRTIDLTGRELEQAMETIDGLPAQGTVKVLGGPYGKEVHDFIKPDSPEGKLLRGGWKSVPPLLISLKKGLPPGRRARVFAALMSLTEAHIDTMRLGDVLGTYEFKGGGWSVSSSSGGGLGFTARATGGGSVSDEAQKKMTRQWDKWAKNLSLKIID